MKFPEYSKNLCLASKLMLPMVMFLSGNIVQAQMFEFDGPNLLNSSGLNDDISDTQPVVVNGMGGVWISAWYSRHDLDGVGTDFDIFYSRSTDDGFSWSPTKFLNSTAKTDQGLDVTPRLATDHAGNWIAVWYTDENYGGTAGPDYDIGYARSTDNGLTWSNPAMLNSHANIDSSPDGVPRIATDGQGTWVGVWQSMYNLNGLSGTDNDIMFTRSSDGGSSWTTAKHLNSTATTDSGSDSFVSLTSDGKGAWMAVWQSSENLQGSIGSDFDIFFSRSLDNGVTWDQTRVLNGNASLDYGDDIYPVVETDGNGNWVVAWQSNDDPIMQGGKDYDIVYSVSGNLGHSWSPVRRLNSNALTDSSHDEAVQLCSDRNGEWLAVWQSDENLSGLAGSDLDVFAAMSDDNGQTWSPVELLLESGNTDSGDDAVPWPATNGREHWVVVWQSKENLGGVIGTDYDILVSTGQLIGGRETPAGSWALYQ